MLTLTPEDLLGAARMAAINAMPYFRAALYALVPRSSPGLGTFAVTETGILMWDPAVFLPGPNGEPPKWTTRQAGGVLLHEVSHVVLDTIGRQGARDPKWWNYAADLAINDALEDAKVEMPTDGMFPSRMGLKKGLTAEEYYAEIQARAQQLGVPETPCACGGWCGSGGGRAVDGEPSGTGNADGKATAEDPLGRTLLELERVRRETAEAIREHASGRGTLPLGLSRWADLTLSPPKVPWQTQLDRALRGAMASRMGAVDLTRSRASRRQSGIGWGPGAPLLAAYHAPKPRVAFGLDTSGSMGDDDGAAALSEAAEILRVAGGEIDLLVCDADLHSVQRVASIPALTSRIEGGGGTDMCPIFDAAAKLVPRPSVLIIATDGEIGGFGVPAEPPRGMRVIWLLTRQGEAPTSWGEAIHVGRTRGAEGVDAAA